jgi:hypothetical protein
MPLIQSAGKKIYNALQQLLTTRPGLWFKDGLNAEDDAVNNLTVARVDYRGLPSQASPVGDETVLIHKEGTDTVEKVTVAQLGGGGGGGEANTGSNVGNAGVGTFDAKVGFDLQFRNVNAASSKLTVALDTPNKNIDIDIVESNLAVPAANVTESGTQVFVTPAEKTAIGNNSSHTVDAAVHVPAGGTIGQHLAKATNTDGDTEWVDASAGGGETNTGSNVNTGGGVGVFDGKVGVDLQFKGVKAETNKVTIADDAINSEITVDVNEANFAVPAANVTESATREFITPEEKTDIANNKTHAADATIHFTEASIDHTAIANIGANSHATIDTKITEFDSHVGSGGAAHADATTSVDGFMTAADKTKLDGIAPGAQTGDMLKSDYAVDFGFDKIVDAPAELSLELTNATGSTVNQGDLVSIDLSALQIDGLSRQDTPVWADAVVVSGSIANAASGIVTVLGYITLKDTSQGSVGDPVYLGTTGGITLTPQHNFQVIGRILTVNATTGIVAFIPQENRNQESEGTKGNLNYVDPLAGHDVILTTGNWIELDFPLNDLNTSSELNFIKGTSPGRFRIDYSGSSAPIPASINALIGFSLSGSLDTSNVEVDFTFAVNGVATGVVMTSFGTAGNQTAGVLQAAAAAINGEGLADQDEISIFARATGPATLILLTYTSYLITTGGIQGVVGGATTHNDLTGRSEPNAHPIAAITNLQTELNSKLDAATTEFDEGALAGTDTIDWATNGKWQTATWANNVTLSFNNPAANRVGWYHLRLVHSGTNTDTITWSSVPKWVNSKLNSSSQNLSEFLLSFYWDGSTWIGTTSNKSVAA